MFDVREHDAHTTIMKATMHHYKGKQTTSNTHKFNTTHPSCRRVDVTPPAHSTLWLTSHMCTRTLLVDTVVGSDTSSCSPARLLRNVMASGLSSSSCHCVGAGPGERVYVVPVRRAKGAQYVACAWERAESSVGRRVQGD